MVRQEIAEELKRVLVELGIEGSEPKLDVPGDDSHGDYSSNIAMMAFAKAKSDKQKVISKNPLELAQEIAKKLNSSLLTLPNIEKVEAVKPGFINFWLEKDYLLEHLREIVGKSSLLASKGDAFQSRKIMVEFADPNPFKEFHIGHLRNISLGESFSRLLETQGAEVWRVNYQGDVGMHVAKALYGLLLVIPPNSFRDLDTAKTEILKQVQDDTVEEKVKLLGEAYTKGAKAFEEDEEAKKEIQALNIKIYKNDPSIKDLWEMGRKWSLEYFETIYKRLGTSYKRYYFESEVAGPGREIVLSHVQDGIFEKHDGAVVFRGEKDGLHTRVFITKEDYATYEAKDLALAKIKYQDFVYDRSIIITAHEQAPYFKVILAAMKKVSSFLAEKTEHYSFGFVSLKEGKMSSRTGNVITSEWLLDEAKRRIKEKFSAKDGPASGWKDMDEETAEIVAVGAVKYSMLKFSTASDISFSFDESISLEGNSGPYIQYTYARTQSVLNKSEIRNPKSETILNDQISKSMENGKWKMENEEVSLLRTIHHFPEVVDEAAENFAPNLLCNYLFDLAQKFNLFYQKHQIIPNVILNVVKDPSTDSGQRLDSSSLDRLGTQNDISRFRLSLTTAVGQVLKNGLYLLGIAAPDRM